MTEIEIILKGKYGIYWEEALLGFLERRTHERPEFHKAVIEALHTGLYSRYLTAKEDCSNAETTAVAAISICKDKSIHQKKNENLREVVKMNLPNFRHYKTDSLSERFVEKVEEGGL